MYATDFAGSVRTPAKEPFYFFFAPYEPPSRDSHFLSFSFGEA
jgi:hypothetical protein